MNLNHLQSFVAVAESLSFSRAAKRLHVSQPALSKQIRSLEEDLSAKLFVRNRRSVALYGATAFSSERVGATAIRSSRGK
jgi:DNA-binding transcriptional LysR family regulator